MQNFNFFLFQRYFINSFLFYTARKTKVQQTILFFQNFRLLKQTSLSFDIFFKAKINLIARNFLKLKSYCNIVNRMRLQQVKNIISVNNFKFKNKPYFFNIKINEKKIDHFLSTQNQKYNGLFFFQFLKKLKKYSLSYKSLHIKKISQLYKNYSAGFFLPAFLEKHFGKVKKNKIFMLKEQFYELIKDTKRKKNRIAKAMLVANNVKFLKKKNWRLPSFLASYIPSKFKKKASSYIFWFNRVFFEKYLKRIRTFPAKLQLKFNFLRDFRFITKKKKNLILFKKFPWKSFYLKNKILFQKTNSFSLNKPNFSSKNFLLLKAKKNKKSKKFLKGKAGNFNTKMFFNFFTNSYFLFHFANLSIFNFFNITFKNETSNTFFSFNFFKKLKAIREKTKKIKLVSFLSNKKVIKQLLFSNTRKKMQLQTLKYLNVFSLKRKQIKRFLNNEPLLHKISKKLKKKITFFFKKSKNFMQRYYKRFFDFYPNETYSFVDKNLGKFQLTLNQNLSFLNVDLKKNKLKFLQKENFLSQKSQYYDDTFLSFFFFCYTFFDNLKFSKTDMLNFVLLQKNVMLLDLLKKKRHNLILRARLQYSHFNMQQQTSIPGKIVFTLNSNSIFLTVSDSSGVTLLQTSTGSVSKTLKANKLKKEAKPGCGFKRRKIARQIKLRRLIKDFSKGKTKKLKKKFIAQMSRRQKGKRRFKTKGKAKFISQDFVKPLFFLLETFLFRIRNLQARKQLLKVEKLKLKLKAKLFKLKKTNKVKTKTYRDIKKKLNEMQKFANIKFHRKNLTLHQKNIVKFLFPLKKPILKTKNRNTGLVKLIEKLRFNKKLKKNRSLSLILKKKISKVIAFKKAYLGSALNVSLAKLNFENHAGNVYLNNLKKKYFLLKQNRQDFFKFLSFNKKVEKQKLNLFFEKLKRLKYSQTFFSSYILCLKNFSIATIRRVFIYALKIFLRKTRMLKKKMKKTTNFYVNSLYLKTLKKTYAF